MPHHDHQRHDEPGPEGPEGPGVERTFDGKRVQLGELNLPSAPQRGGALSRLRRNLALFLAGMYTGESCAGTPHSERRTTPGKDDDR